MTPDDAYSGTDRPQPLDPKSVAHDVLHALEAGTQVEPFSTHDATFDLARGYATAAALRELRGQRGERSVGRKIGFTNTAAWPGFGISEPIWGDVYDTSLSYANAGNPARATLSLPHLCELKLEPEIVFGLGRKPEAEMDDLALLGCIAWIALGFEIVQSVYPGWRFAAADAVANAGLHAALVVGPRFDPTSQSPEALVRQLETCTVTLSCDDRVVEHGSGASVLGSPLRALSRLVRIVAADASAPALRPGEVVTTGTLTRAVDLAPGYRWTARIDGLPLDSFELTA